jgi:LuxR family transcriptional regulator, maltose regulon positive regulatory protein
VFEGSRDFQHPPAGDRIGAVPPSRSGVSSAASAWTGGVVSRGELFERLRGARRVSVVSAPAGSGKTFLLRSWIREQGLAESAACVSVLPDERDE